MNRTIKFRIYNKKSQKWEEPAPLFALGLDGELIHIHNDNGEYVYQQFTGLTDKNGKEVYEGDILKHSFPVCENNDNISVVRWTNEEEDNHPGFMIYRLTTQGGPYEVIGNIFDNPELLK